MDPARLVTEMDPTRLVPEMDLARLVTKMDLARLVTQIIHDSCYRNCLSRPGKVQCR